MKIYNFKLLAPLIMAFVPFMALAVSQKEMEQARTIAAKAYLRYANDGSGYLDDINPATMQELEAALKNKEKENIKAFKEIPVPSDYKDWDKEKLVEYWAVTAFQNKGLLDKGRGGRIRARSQINKMTIAPPQAETAVAAPAPQAQETVKPELKKLEEAENPAEALQDLKAEEQSMLAQQEVEEEEATVDKAYNYTWVYIMALAILVVIVIALVVYGANVMKQNGGKALMASQNKTDKGEDKGMKAHYDALIADKDMEISMLKKKLESSTRQTSELRMKLENLSSELAILKAATGSPAIASEKIAVQDYPKETTAQKSGLRSIFLGRANSRGIFVRADRTLNPGNSVFVLETADGFSGTFRVVDSPSVWSMVLSNPVEYLSTACMGHHLEDPGAATRVVTESAGTAVFEGGCWRVIRKARIRYE